MPSLMHRDDASITRALLFGELNLIVENQEFLF